MFISTANILRLVFCHELLSLACEINANILATCKTLIKYEAGEKNIYNRLAGTNFLPNEWPVNSPIQRLSGLLVRRTMYYLNIASWKKHTSQMASHRYPLNYSLIITGLLLESSHAYKNLRVTLR